MPLHLVAIHHPDDYDPSKEDETMGRDIDALNHGMVAAGARIFAGGPPSTAESLRAQLDSGRTDSQQSVRRGERESLKIPIPVRLPRALHGIFVAQSVEAPAMEMSHVLLS